MVSKQVGSDDLRCLCIFAGFSNMSLMEEPETPRSEALQEESDLTTKMKETMAEMMTPMMESMQENIWKKLNEYIVGNEASKDSDEATNDVNISRPPHDLQTTSDLVDKYLEPPPPSQLSWEHISQEFSVAEKTGPAIDEKLAQLVTGLIPEKLPRTKLDELVELYPRPDNCPLLVAPKCNKGVFAERSKVTCCSGMCSYSGYHEGFRRLENPVKSTELFGDDIGKEIDELNKTSQIGLKLFTSHKERGRYHPKNTSLRGSKRPSTFRCRDDRNQNNRLVGLQSFFGQRNAYRRKPAGKSGNTLTRTGPH